MESSAYLFPIGRSQDCEKLAAILGTMVETLPPGEIVATADQRLVLYNIPWSHYEVLLALRGERPVPRMCYREGTLELMTPSFDHELIKSTLGRLIEAYADHKEIDLTPVGSWTIRSAREQRGADPDECFIVGTTQGRSAPDFVIDVIWTSGGLEKLDVWRGLGVSEVWIWKSEALELHALQGDRSERVEDSRFVPGVDLPLLARLARLKRPDALRELRASFRTP